LKGTGEQIAAGKRFTKILSDFQFRVTKLAKKIYLAQLMQVT
jgi:hypothetical protein